MKAEIITIGDELLIGQTIDTNSAWMGSTLNAIGIRVNRITSISDEKSEILSAIDTAFDRANLILVTGGLGPTNDDITKATLAEYFDSEMEINDAVLVDIESYFKRKGKETLEVNRLQASLPSKARIVRNLKGTASGMWFDHKGKVLISMPGVPYEMKHLMEDGFIPMISAHFNTTPVYHHTVLTMGMGESHLSMKIKNWEDSLAESDLKLAYLPSPGIVKLRLTAHGPDKAELKVRVDKKVKELEALIPDLVYGYNTDRLEELVGDLLSIKGKKVATAESCTGGYIAHLITTVPGSSQYYEGSFATYSYTSKTDILGVDAELIKEEGAVSGEVVKSMALGLFDRFEVDYAIAVSGIAGPSGGTEDKPVGTVWMAVGTKEKMEVKRFQFGNHRVNNIRMTALNALNTLRKQLLMLN
jgi:nicotinamide-nucleotide amidase